MHSEWVFLILQLFCQVKSKELYDTSEDSFLVNNWLCVEGDIGLNTHLKDLCSIYKRNEIGNQDVKMRNEFLNEIVNAKNFQAKVRKKRSAVTTQSFDVLKQFLEDYMDLMNQKRTLIIIPSNLTINDYQFLTKLSKRTDVGYVNVLSEDQFVSSKSVQKSGQVIVPFQLRNADDTINFAVKNGMVSKCFTWLLRTSDESPYDSLKATYFPIYSNFYTFHILEDYVRLNEIYSKGSGHENEVHTWNLWKPTAGFSVQTLNQLERRSDLTGIEIKGASLQSPPYVYTNKIANTDRIEIDGFVADIWKSFEDIFNFTTLIWESEDGRWGPRDPDGTWRGMLGMINRSKVDVAICEMGLSLIRKLEFDTTFPFLTVQGRVYIPTPGRDFDWNTFVSPFHWSTWVALVLSLTTISFLWKLMHVSLFENDATFLDLIESLTHLIFQQGSNYEPESKTSLRVVLLVWATFSMLVFAAYSAQLVSGLTIVKLGVPFSSWEGFYEHGDNYKIGAIDSSPKRLEKGTSVQQKIYQERLHIPETVTNFDSAIDYLKTKLKWGFMWDEVGMAVELSKTCDILTLDLPTLGKSRWVIHMKKNYEYTELFNYSLMKIRETGLLNKMWRKWKPTPKEDCFQSTSATPIGYENIVLMFVLLPTAYLLSAIILVGELLYNFHVKSSRNEVIAFER